MIKTKYSSSGQELYHEIFGSILERTEMTPYLLLQATNYEAALRQAARMMGNRGFDTSDSNELNESEKKRAQQYIAQAYSYCFDFMFPFLKKQLEGLKALNTKNQYLYTNSLQVMEEIEAILRGQEFREIVAEDPRHLFLLASSKKYPHVFYGYKGQNLNVTPGWQRMACSILKVAHLIKSIEEESQDVNDFAQLGLFFESKGQSLHDIFNYDWENPGELPESEAAQRAFVKISAFFHKLKEFVKYNVEQKILTFNSGDGVEVDIVEIKARLKSPESMFTKLGKNLEGEAYNIRDLLAITFILKKRDDTLKLFHALQKRGVILQENTISQSITQTLFDLPEDMTDAVGSLMASLSMGKGKDAPNDKDEVSANANNFYNALGVNTANNPYSSLGHKKFQCKINFFLPIHRIAGTGKIIIPGTAEYKMRGRLNIKTEQHTLALELRISDEKSWQRSEYSGESHHNAYKFRQLISVMNRVFKNIFNLPEKSFSQVRSDQDILFS
ncbi:MAG: hypothetical protein Q7U10_05540 [Thermodesulfovibrionia bacterium]|nr:hypothetical protein [Thermodesulfovibrionia bacterium]